jgi:serine/threonine protein phosphatase 1
MMKKWVNLLKYTTNMPLLSPDQPFTAVGDIHGRADLLKKFLINAPDRQIICVGDYIDRGDHSTEVLSMLHARPDIICLSGNHEEMMLSFLDNPKTHGPRWLRYGGLQTLASFGISGVTETSAPQHLSAARDALYRAIEPKILNWLEHLPTTWQSGNVAIAHAAMDPFTPIQNQVSGVLHWGHPDFMRLPRSDGIWVIHGHTIVDVPTIQNGRIAIDTGAYATGKLTAAHIGAASAHFEIVI